MIARGYILVMMVPIIFFVPGVYATSMSIWAGGCGNNFHDSTTLNAPETASVFGHSVVQGGTLTQDASGSGDLHKSYVADNGNGEIASITADVYRAEKWNYISKPVRTFDATSAEVDGHDFGLTVNNARKIECSAGASNQFGDIASANIEIKRGSLINWRGLASANLQGAGAWQAFDKASGKGIEMIGTSSSNKEKDWADSSITIEDGSLSASGATGKRIVCASSSSNAEKDRAKTWMEVEGTNKHLGTITMFNSGTSVSPTEVSATQTIGSASGKEIELGASSSNKERNKAKTWMEVEGTNKNLGSISDYSSTASTTTTTASAQLSNTSPNSVATGKRIVFAASGSDAARDKTSAYTEVKHGAINGLLTNFANVNMITNTLISSQSASGVSGTKINVQAKAKNNGVKAHEENKLLYPINLAFHNNANVIAGTPTVGQGFP